MALIDERGVHGFFADIIQQYPEAEELLEPARVEQDLTVVRRMIRQIPIVASRRQAYIDLAVDPWEWTGYPNQTALDAYPRENIISAFMQEYSDVPAATWVNTILRFYPEKAALAQFVIELRSSNLSSQQILMQVLERQDLTNNEIATVGW